MRTADFDISGWGNDCRWKVIKALCLVCFHKDHANYRRFLKNQFDLNPRTFASLNLQKFAALKL
jgi:hypothetical protein